MLKAGAVHIRATLLSVHILFHRKNGNTMAETQRKGARTRNDIPKEIAQQLNAGHIQTANLVEWLAVDQRALLRAVLQETGRTAYLSPIATAIENLPRQTVNTINEAIGTGIAEQARVHSDNDILAVLATHTSDVVRCWATYPIGRSSNLSMSDMLERIYPFAADAHFAVREIAWISIRPHIAQNLAESIRLLSQWTTNVDENIRRFASEATRPCGVWCEHIKPLKLQPDIGLPILEPLRSDSAKYVQDSVGNWLNDASKTAPDFVVQLCDRWKSESNTKATSYIIKRALRTLRK